MKYLGDYSAGSVVAFAFNTRDSSAALVAMAGSPVVKVYKHGNTTEVTTGVTLAEAFDARTGLHTVAVDTSADGTFYATANDFYIVLTAGTVDGVSQVGTVLAQFSIGNRASGGGGGLDAAGVRAAVGLASANLDTQLGAIDDYIDSEVTAIKSKTDNLPASPASSTNVSDAQTAILAKLLKYVRLLARKDAATATDQATELTEINANAGSGAGGYANTSDALEALADTPSGLDAAGVRAAVGLASANLDTQLGAIDYYIDSEVAAIKSKTDNLPASPASSTNVSDAQTAILAKLLKYVRLLARKDAATATDQATELTEINANAGSGAGGYANTTNSLESGFEASLTLPAVDGIPLEDALAAILGAVVGVRSVTDNVVTFYARDGETLLGTLTIGDTAGVIETSVLAAD